MKDNFTHVCFIIDESGSMYSSVDDVKGGFKKIIDEQKSNKIGECAISMYTFNGLVTNHFTLRDSREVDSELTYRPGGSTALNDAVGTAIDEIGRKLAAMDESQRPSSNLIVIMTDGGENSSKFYSLSRVREKIKEQTEKYNWTFMYLGADITTSDIADSLDIKYRSYSTKKSLDTNYSMINNILYCSRAANSATASAAMNSAVTEYVTTVNAGFAEETGTALEGVSK